MPNTIVVSSDLTLDWLEKRRNLFKEIESQLIKGLKAPGNGLSLDHLQALVEHRDPFEWKGFRVLESLTIEIPALPRPTLSDVQKKYPWVKKIEKDVSLEELVVLELATVLPGGEDDINGEEYEKRLAVLGDRLLGYQHREWLLEHQDEFPALKPLLGKIYIDFPGIIVVSVGGDRDYPYAIQIGDRWDDFWDWIGRGFCSSGRVAVSRK